MKTLLILSLLTLSATSFGAAVVEDVKVKNNTWGPAYTHAKVRVRGNPTDVLELKRKLSADSSSTIVLKSSRLNFRRKADNKVFTIDIGNTSEAAVDYDLEPIRAKRRDSN